MKLPEAAQFSAGIEAPSRAQLAGAEEGPRRTALRGGAAGPKWAKSEAEAAGSEREKLRTEAVEPRTPKSKTEMATSGWAKLRGAAGDSRWPESDEETEKPATTRPGAEAATPERATDRRDEGEPNHVLAKAGRTNPMCEKLRVNGAASECAKFSTNAANSAHKRLRANESGPRWARSGAETAEPKPRPQMESARSTWARLLKG